MSQDENTVEEGTVTEMKPQGQGGKKAKKQGTKKEPKAKKEPRPKKERPVRAVPAHMSKVDKVAAQLPPLSSDAHVLFTAANNMSTADMNSLVAHLNISIRRRGVMALAQGGSAAKLQLGDRVRVRSGSGGAARFVGQVGTVSKLQRIRCYVRLEGRSYSADKPGDYFFIADVEPTNAAQGGGNLADTITRLTATPAPVDISMIEDEKFTEEDAAATG